MYPLSVIQEVILILSSDRKILHSTPSSEIIPNWLIVEETFSFGTKQLSAFF